MNGAKVRAYEPGDRAACLALFDANVGTFFVEEERRGYASFLDALPGPYLVVEDGEGRVVACGGWARARWTRTVDLCWDIVAPDRQGQGLGRMLVAARLERIRGDRRAKRVALNTSQHTRGFYERFGFRAVRVIPDGFAPGLDRVDMELDPRAPPPR